MHEPESCLAWSALSAKCDTQQSLKKKNKNKELHLKAVGLGLQLSLLSENQPYKEARTLRASRNRGRQTHALLCKALQAASASLVLQGQLCEVDTVVQHFPRVTVKTMWALTQQFHAARSSCGCISRSAANLGFKHGQLSLLCRFSFHTGSWMFSSELRVRFFP